MLTSIRTANVTRFSGLVAALLVATACSSGGGASTAPTAAPTAAESAAPTAAASSAPSEAASAGPSAAAGGAYTLTIVTSATVGKYLSGEDGKTWGAFLLSPTQSAWKVADTSKQIPDYQKALALAEESDRLSPSPTAAFFGGVSAFSIGIASLQAAQKPKSCPMAKTAQEMFTKTQMYMPRGGAIDAGTAKTVLGYVGQYSPAADQMVKQYCK